MMGVYISDTVTPQSAVFKILEEADVVCGGGLLGFLGAFFRTRIACC